jgi:cell division protein FtsI (penicillin-binding protein 3)
MEKEMKKRLGRRIGFIQFFLVACLVLLAAKSFEIQIFEAKDLTQKAEEGYLRDLTVKGDRGEILDRNLNKLGTSIDAPNITADPGQIRDAGKAAAALAKVLDMKKSDLRSRLSQDRRFVMVARRVSSEQAQAVKALNIAGIYLKADTRRVYPNRSLAAQVIGFTGKDDTGLEGLEYRFNAVLEGSQVRSRVKRDGAGRILDINKARRDQLRGNAIVLTIDKKIQFLSEQALEQAVRKFRAKSGMALVMRPQTGELLAMAHYPLFNPNNFGRFNQATYRNRAVTDAFEPGSIMKVFTVAAAIEKGITPGSIFFCENGDYKVGSYTVHDTHDHDWLSMAQIIKFSSNIGAIKISETIGSKALHHYLTAFGFGDKTRMGSPGESSGTLLPYPKWSKIDTAAISFGQGISVTGVQLISAISAIANNGRLMQPMLVKKILSHTGKELKEFRPTVIRQVISPATAAVVKKMMNQVVEADGTGTQAAMQGYQVCGKTSTAQKATGNGKGYARNKYIAAFGGFAPLDNPELAILIVVDEPKKEHYGGIVAAPAFKSIMTQSFSYLNIPPTQALPMIAGLAQETDQ